MKEAFLKRDWRVVADPEVVATLTDPAKSRYLAPFVRTERTLTEAARDLGIKPNALLYQVRRLLRLGLLRVVRTQPRAGRASKVYRASARRFIVPFDATSAETRSAIVQRLRSPRDRQTAERWVAGVEAHARPAGLWLWLSEEGVFEGFYAPLEGGWLTDERYAAPDFPALFARYLEVPLEPADAKELQLELIRLLERARSRAAPGRERYLLNLSIVPVGD